MDTGMNLECNWLWTGGSDLCDLSKSIKTQRETEDISIKPNVEEIISEVRAVLFSKPENAQDECRLLFKLEPHNKIAALSLLCTTSKIEMYVGPYLEYGETFFGEQVDDESVYIYHMDIKRSGIIQMELKFITPETNVCIFGMIMQIAPNPNGITTQQNINMNNVHDILNSSSKNISEKSEKCKLFLEMMSKMSAMSAESATSTIPNTKASCSSKKSKEPPDSESDAQKELSDESSDLVNFEKSIKQHIDKRFLELDLRVNAQLENINTKFTQILYHLTGNSQQ